jgi:hypothetical protein
MGALACDTGMAHWQYIGMPHWHYSEEYTSGTSAVHWLVHWWYTGSILTRPPAYLKLVFSNTVEHSRRLPSRTFWMLSLQNLHDCSSRSHITLDWPTNRGTLCPLHNCKSNKRNAQRLVPYPITATPHNRLWAHALTTATERTASPLDHQRSPSSVTSRCSRQD